MGKDDFAEFYAATFGPLCVQLHAHTGDLAEAQDVVQEAFCRALPRWTTLAEYDDPAAWVRKVAWNLATSRWRRMRKLVEFSKAQNISPVPPPSPDRLDLMVALAALPAPQREALVLHYIGGVSVAEIAHITGVSIGTVKSRLHRARAAMADLLTAGHVDMEPGAPPPGVNQVYRTVQQRRSNKTRAAAAAVVGIVCLAVLAISVRRPVNPPIDNVVPSQTPSSSPSPAPSASATASPLVEVPGNPNASAGRGPTQPIACAGLYLYFLQLYANGEVIVVPRQVEPIPGQERCVNPRTRVFWASYTIDEAGMHHLYRSQEFILRADQEQTMQIVEPTTCWGGWFVVEGDVPVAQSFPSDPDPYGIWNEPYPMTKRNMKTTTTPCAPPSPTPTPTP